MCISREARFSKMYHQVLFMTLFFFFWTSISFLKKDAGHVSCPCQYGPFSLHQAGPQTTKTLLLIPLGSYNKPCGAGWLLSPLQAPPPRPRLGDTFQERCLAEKLKRPGEGAQGHKRCIDLGLRASQRKRTRRGEASCLNKQMWNLNGVLLREERTGIWDLLFVHHTGNIFRRS